MSYKKVFILSMTVIFSVLFFTCIIGNNHNIENELMAHTRSTAEYKNWRPFVPATSKEAHEQFVVETLLLRCENKCNIYDYYVIEDLSSVCRDTCYEIWAFLSRAKDSRHQ